MYCCRCSYAMRDAVMEEICSKDFNSLICPSIINWIFFLLFPGSNWTQATLTPPKSTKAHQEDDDDLFYLPTFNEEAIQQVAEMLTNTLRDAKQRHLLACTEVLLPCELLQRIGVEMLLNSDEEACGIRGCNIIIKFEDEMGNTKKIASTKTDPNTVSTFELILTLKQDRSGWTSILPQFLK